MSFLPIVTRELRVAGRKPGTYWQRTGAALGLILVGTWLFLVMQNQSPRELASYLFGALTVGALFYALLSGLRATADCLSIEKREGTLGLLFLTDLKGYDVILGKLAATSLNAFYSVVAVVAGLRWDCISARESPASSCLADVAKPRLRLRPRLGCRLSSPESRVLVFD